MAQLGRNDPCHCNSGKKYKKCHLPLEEGRDRRSALLESARSLRSKNLALLEAMGYIFGLSRPWKQVKEDFSEAQVREFYSFVAGLWPTHTNLVDLFPEPDSSLRALYLGENEPEMMLQNVFRFSLYTDQIILLNPFINPNVVAKAYNPTLHPGEWKLQTLRIVFHLLLLSPWIDAGLVMLIPDPGDFDWSLRNKTWKLAQERLEGWEPSAEDIDSSAIKWRTRRSFLMAPRDYLERVTREATPGISDEQIQNVLSEIESERANDPLLLNETLDRIPGQMLAANMGANLEMGLYISELTGAFPYTNVKSRWKEILGARKKLDTTAEIWSPLTNAFQQLTFKFLDNVDSQFACTLRQEQRLEGFRAYLRRLWNTVGGEADPSKSEGLARDFRDELLQAFNEASAEWDKIDRDLLKWGLPKMGGGAGIGAVASAIATGHMSLEFGAAGFVIEGISELIQSAMKRREFRKKTPMSVFIDLEHR